MTRSNVDNALYFVGKEQHASNLDGDIDGYVSFAQSHTIAPTGNNDAELPRLVANRQTLLMLTLPTVQEHNQIQATVINATGEELGTVQLLPPRQLPLSDRPTTLDLDKPDVRYAENTWSAVLEWHWIQPGISLVFNDQQGLSGSLHDIDVGAENEVVLQNIRIGMLTAPSSVHELEQQPLLAADYFQKLPISRLTVGNYTPIHWEKIVLPNGTTYTEESAVEGGVYSGDMRENIAKSLVSMGVNNANFGINDSAGSAQWQPGYYNQYVVHKAIGRYSNGDITHGLSGGNGMATLINTVGNELSHELGHAYGMGHYPGGGFTSTHNQGSGWGWDAFHNRFIANFFWDQSGSTTTEGDVTEPFNHMYRFNTDAMAGGVASSVLSQFTHHTGYTAKRIQHNFENTGRLTSDGYTKWNSNQNQMVDNRNSGATPIGFGTDVVTFVGYYDPEMTLSSHIYPAMYGSFGHTYQQSLPNATQCWADVSFADGRENQLFALKGQRSNASEMNKFHFNIARSDKPTQISVFCPESNPLKGYKDWLLNHFNVDTFHAWADSRTGNIGDIYEYERNGNKEYYRLKKTHYWYFPAAGQNNSDWEFVGYGNTLHAEFNEELSNLPFDPSQGVELDTRVISQPATEPKPSIIVGEEYGYEMVKQVAAQQTATFADISATLEAQNFESYDDFRAYIQGYYKQANLLEWNEQLVSTLGQVYRMADIASGEERYYASLTGGSMISPENDPHGEHWKFLGSLDQYVNFAINPLRIDLSIDGSIEDHLLAIYGQETILSFEESAKTSVNGQIFKTIDDEQVHYFIQRVAGTVQNFPTVGQSNEAWIYLNTEVLEPSTLENFSLERDTFEEAVLQWYEQERLQAWSDNKKGRVGDIYFYDFHDGKRHYYRLKTDSYGYFPYPTDPNGNSSNDWQYLAAYIPGTHSQSLILYVHGKYNGEYVKLNGSVMDLGSMKNKMSSFKIPKGWIVRFYTGTDLTGTSYERTSDSTDGNFASEFNDSIRSVEVIADSFVTIYKHSRYSGDSLVLDQNMPSLGAFSAQMSSFKIPEGWKVRFYTEEDFQGDYYTRTADSTFDNALNDSIKSVKILAK